LTNLTKNLDEVLYFPYDDLQTKLTFLENALALEELYEKIEKTSEFKALQLTDYNGKKYSVNEVIDLVKKDIYNYIQSDNGLSYFKDCFPWFGRETCSNGDITAKFLNLNISVE
jgi:uncharacterized protein YlzI (FlbEa/FlbD family)